MSHIISSAEPFYFPGGPVGCLLIHGFTGTPKEMRWMGEYLAAQGHTVLGVRLAGHATCPEDLLRCRWTDWLASVEDGWDLLNGPCQHVFVIGLSMGGALSLLFASQFPVAGIVAMSTPWAIQADWRLNYVRWLSLLQPVVSKGTPDWKNESAAQEHIDYPFYPTRSIAELLDLLTEMRASLSQVTAPALLVHSRQDGSVNPENMEKIYSALASLDKQKLLVENSGHVIPREPEREKVFQAVGEFILRITSGVEAPR